MESLMSAHIVQVPSCHLKQNSQPYFPTYCRRLTIKLHQHPSGIIKTTKLLNPGVSSIHPLKASTTDFFENKLPPKEVLDLWTKVEAVCFDVDSTVCIDEGIDEFAEFCGAGKAVAEWTSRAMNGSVTFQEALAARLSLINPSLAQLEDFLEKRPPRLSPGIAELVKKLKAKGIDVYLVSGGFRQMINPVASILEIPLENIFANQLLFGNSGEFLGFDENEPTSRSGGKAVAVQQIRKARTYRTLGMIGDGATDLEALRENSCPGVSTITISSHEGGDEEYYVVLISVTNDCISGGADFFICYAGVQLREAVASKADWLVFNFDDLINALE